MRNEAPFDEWPPGYSQYDVASVDGVTLIRQPGDKAIVFMTAVDGLKVAMVIDPGEILGIARTLVAHVAPAEIMQKNLVAINGGKAG